MCSQISGNLIRVNKISNSFSKSHSAKTCSCELDRTKANDFIKEEYEKSSHTRVYIGEWHTHPEDYPTPSSIDLSSFKSAFRKNDRPIRGYILMAIVGRKETYWGLYSGKELKQIKPYIV